MNWLKEEKNINSHFFLQAITVCYAILSLNLRLSVNAEIDSCGLQNKVFYLFLLTKAHRKFMCHYEILRRTEVFGDIVLWFCKQSTHFQGILQHWFFFFNWIYVFPDVGCSVCPGCLIIYLSHELPHPTSYLPNSVDALLWFFTLLYLPSSVSSPN